MKEILVREKCSACDGTWFTTHPAWERYWRAHHTLGEQGLREWFAQEGYDEREVRDA